MNLLNLTSKIAAGLALASLLGAASAQSVTLNFDDIGAGSGGIPMPTGYAAFDWGSMYYAMSSTTAPGNTYVAMGSGSSTVIRSWDGKPFYFDGADYWSRRGLDANGTFYYVLYLKGQTVYNGQTAKKGGKMLFTGTPTWLRPNYTGPIDAIALTFRNNGRDWNHLAFDNFRIRQIP